MVVDPCCFRFQRRRRGRAQIWSRTRMWPRVSAEQVERMIEDKSFSWAEAGSDFGYHPRPFADGVALEAQLLGLSIRRGQAHTSAERTKPAP